MSVVENPEDLIPLSILQPGRHAEVCTVSGAPELVRRLAELGIRVGTFLEMISPGKTCILRVAESKLCLRGDELLQVLVAPLALSRQLG